MPKSCEVISFEPLLDAAGARHQSRVRARELALWRKAAQNRCARAQRRAARTTSPQPTQAHITPTGENTPSRRRWQEETVPPRRYETHSPQNASRGALISTASAPRKAKMSGYGGYEYDNANADSGGGGFLSQSNRESEGGEKEKKPRDKQTLTPVTIKQLQSAEKGVGDDDGYKIDNAEIHSVRVVACVQTDEVRETKATYNIEDGTGSVEVTFWLNDAQDEDSWARQKLAKMTPGAYVVVHGNIKEYDGRLTISAYDMRPVEDFNQVTHHYLEAIYVHAKRVGKIQVSSGAAAGR